MRNRLTLALLLSTLAISGVACTRMRSARFDLPSYQMHHAGLERTYRLMVPASYDPAMATPLVLALHGGGGNGEQMCTLPGGIQELAQREGFIVICPDAVENHWNDGRGNQEYRSRVEDIDDVGFLLGLIGRLSEDYNVDPARIYVTGASNGGMMTQRMACEASGTFAAAAVVIASQPANLDCEPNGPISILFMNGTDDPLMPFEGGEVHFYRQGLGEVLSTQDTVSFWASANGCDRTPETELLPDLDPGDGTRIRLDAYSGCDRSVQVLLYTVEGGGHSWPGGSQYLPRSVIGRVSRDLHANEAIWGFFDEG